MKELDVAAVDTSVFNSRFRVVKVGDQRKGIRLEEIFWTGLKDIARFENTTVGEIIRQCEDRVGDSGNLTSAIRVEVARRMKASLDTALHRTDMLELRKLVTASPSPSFILSDDRRIVAYNIQFLSLLQSKLTRFPVKAAAHGVRLTLDVQFQELISRLRIPGSGPATVGFVVAYEGQSFRARLSAALAPTLHSDAILGYVISSTER